MKNYRMLKKLFQFPTAIDIWEAEQRRDRSRALVVRFPHRGDVDASVYDRAWRYAEQLRNIPQLLMPLDIEIGGKGVACEIAFEYPDEVCPLAEFVQLYGHELWIMQSVLDVLEDLHRRRADGQFVGKEAIFVDKENYAAHLCFAGLAEIFCAYSGGKNDVERYTDWRDDVYNLARCFESNIEKLPESKAKDVVERCLLEDSGQRPKPEELFRETRGISAFRPEYKEKVELYFDKRFDCQEKENIVKLINQYDCYITEWKNDPKGRMRKKCNFFVDGCKGAFINSRGDEHYFVPYFSRENFYPQGEILRVQFSHTTESRRGRSPDKYHHLTELDQQKSDAVKKWRLVPEEEKKFIQENAFKAKYQYRHIWKNDRKISFILCAGADLDWQKINILKEKNKEKNKQLDAVSMYVNHIQIKVGDLDDIRPRWILRVKSDRNDIPPSGRIRIDGESEEFDFYWRNESILYFASKISNPSECTRTPRSGNPTVLIDKVLGKVGTLDGESEFQEIITKDFEGKRGEVIQLNESGELCEDINQEIVSCKRQIESVGLFERNDMVEPKLGSILATPKEHKPIAIPPAARKLQFFKDNLNDSQKDAVIKALCQKPLSLIHGPPGTGKTTVIVEIVRQVLKMNPRARILVCSQANLAVDNVVERLPDERGLRKVRLALNDKKLTSEAKKFHFDNRFKEWINDTVSRSKKHEKRPQTAMANAFAKSAGERDVFDPKQASRIGKIVKKWHQFIRNEEAEIRANVEGGWSSLEMAFLRSMNIVGATCVHIASYKYREIFGDRYDYLIMDEAGKATPAETLIPVVRAKVIVLIGDHRQLPPFVTSEKNVLEAVKEAIPVLEDAQHENLRKIFSKSLFEKLISAFSNEKSIQAFLATQRRMPIRLGKLISKYFYNGELKNPDDKEFSTEKRANLPDKWKTGVLFINTARRKNRNDNGESKWRQNACNAEVVVESLRVLSEKFKKLESRLQVSVIAGYCGQVDLLRRKVKQAGCLEGNVYDLINTVDGFQGRESDVVIYDVVRSSQGNGYVGFLDEPRRLNVALSRAGKLLIIVGDAAFLSSRAKPSKDREKAKKPILGEIVDELAAEGLVFDSLQDSLK